MKSRNYLSKTSLRGLGWVALQKELLSRVPGAMPSLAWACFDRREMVKLEMHSGHRKTRRVYNTDGDAHLLTISCFRRLPLLNKSRTCQWMVDGIGLARKKNPFDLWGWGIMPEQVHLILMPHANVRMSMTRSIQDDSTDQFLHAVARVGMAPWLRRELEIYHFGRK
ncbi:hypothetical protein KOR42_55760 [Thalassoglobus neptunius]|uniref:Transposase IS200 like protein n=1 Tax=Thalassoglobus neptunius TaxID=1938619 RepID=A0A5C5UUV4_9PLAN|nr:hypothetical protein [Thalassoglobus neptunius]TWT29135.1 hypothetical protein KOR42_55760 [Thalassoglobus neptunius]